MTLAEFITEVNELGLAPDAALKIVTFASRLRHGERDGLRDGTVTDAERARRYRARKSVVKSTAKANDVAVSTVTERHENVTAERDELRDVCLLKEEQDSQQEKTEKRKKDTASVNGRARGFRLDAAAELSDRDRLFAREQGLADGQIGKLWIEFVDYWIAVPGQRGVKLDWSATWRNRVRAIVDREPRHAQTIKRDASVVSAGRRLLERIGDFDRQNAPSGSEGNAIVRLLPKE